MRSEVCCFKVCGQDKSLHEQLHNLIKNQSQLLILPWASSDRLPFDVMMFDLRHDQISTAEKNQAPSHLSYQKLAIISPERSKLSELYELGFDDFCIWPFNQNELLRRMIACLMIKQEVKKRRLARDRLLNQLCFFLINNLDETIQLKDLVAQVSLSKDNIRKKFKAEFGLGPMAWFKKQRINSACRLLLSGEHSVMEVALSVGYKDANNFSTAFKNQMGISPKKYVQLSRNQR